MVIKQSKNDIVFDFFNYAVLIILFFIIALPLVFIVNASFSDPRLVASGEVLLYPKGVTLEGYKNIFNNRFIWSGYANTILYTITGVAVNMLFTVCCAYAVSRDDFIPRNLIMRLVTFTMFFSGGMIPKYLIVKNMGMLDTIWSLTVAVAVPTYYLIVCRTFFRMNIPRELQEAAGIDGCGDFRFFVSIVLPLSTSLLAVMCLFFAVSHWNTYFNAMIYINNRGKFPLQLVLKEILVDNEIQSSLSEDLALLEKQRLADSIKYGVIIVSTLPVMILYPFVQKFFVKGVMICSVKG